VKPCPNRGTASACITESGALVPRPDQRSINQPRSRRTVTVSDHRERRVHQGASRTRLTIAEICVDLGISRSTFYEWRAKGRAPRCIKLPNGDIRISRAEYERWLTALEEAA